MFAYSIHPKCPCVCLRAPVSVAAELLTSGVCKTPGLWPLGHPSPVEMFLIPTSSWVTSPWHPAWGQGERASESQPQRRGHVGTFPIAPAALRSSPMDLPKLIPPVSTTETKSCPYPLKTEQQVRPADPKSHWAQPCRHQPWQGVVSCGDIPASTRAMPACSDERGWGAGHL